MTTSNAHNPPTPLEDPAQFLATGLELATSRAGGLARALAERALALHGNDPQWQALAQTVLRQDVPDYHIRMLRDRLRNGAYRDAIERFAPGRTVLDIGTGSGLLAMMAARAGAVRVFACEVNAMLAASARSVIAANGLADCITVLDCHSTALDRMRDLDGGVELVMSEVFSHDLIGEGVLGSLAHAREHLALPGAKFLPERASIVTALADFPAIPEEIGVVEGFDLTAFAAHLHAARHRSPEDPAIALRSAPADVFAFDFSNGALPLSGTSNVQLVSNGGRISGLAQWLRLTFAEDIVYENRPGSGTDLHWMINLFPNAAPCAASAGKPFDVGASYAADTLAAWLRPGSAEG
ncbi:MAG: methyltransferase [Rhizobiales bacterium]|nr:methyltransferase [Hyphomicrobiales bacterium]